MVGYDIEDANHISRYVKSRGLYNLFLVSLLVFYSSGFIISSLSESTSPDQVALLVVTAFLYILMLGIYGFFLPWYMPERYDSDWRLVIEGLLIVIVVVSPENIAVSFIIFISLLLILTFQVLRQKKIDIKTILRKEDEPKEFDIVFEKFREVHPTFVKILSLVFLASYVFVLITTFLNLISMWIALVIFFAPGMLFGFTLVFWKNLHEMEISEKNDEE